MTRRLAIWLLLLLVFVSSVVIAITTEDQTSGTLAVSLEQDGVSYAGTVVQGGSGSRVALVPITGALTDGVSASDGSSTGAEDIVRMLDAIVEDSDSWDGIILELDTPGGSVLASEEITEALKRVHRADIPVVAWMRGTAASAGYYIAASSDEIVASRHTFTGSIGVILEYFVLDGLADKVGVKAVTIKSGKLKDIGSPYRATTPQERQIFQAIIDEAYGQFVATVAAGRGMGEQRVRELADGRIYTGAQAKELGLVDTLGLRRTAYSRMARRIRSGDHGGDLKVVRFSRSYDFFELLGASARPSLDMLASAAQVRGALGGDPEAVRQLLGHQPGARQVGSGFAQLQYRAALG